MDKDDEVKVAVIMERLRDLEEEVKKISPTVRHNAEFRKNVVFFVKTFSALVGVAIALAALKGCVI